MPEAELTKIQKAVGQNIRRIRKEKGMTQQELAYRCDFEKFSMWRLESGGTNMTLGTMVKVCKALECNLQEIVDI